MIYFIQDGDFVKIGYSKDPRARLVNLQCANSRTLEIVGIMAGEKEHESWLHTAFNAHRVRSSNEWFFFSDAIHKFIQKHGKPYNQSEIDEIIKKERKEPSPRSSVFRGLADEPRMSKLDEAKSFIRNTLSSEPQRSGYLRRIAPQNGITISTYDNAIRQLLNGGEIEVINPGALGNSRLLSLKANGNQKDIQEDVPLDSGDGPARVLKFTS